MGAQPPNPRARRVFISYGRDEYSDVALQIKEDLLARGHEVWFDAREIKPGADWERYIEEGLNWAARDRDGRMLLLMTPHAVRRPDGYCLNEIAKALKNNLLIVPVMLVWCEPPLSLYRIQWLDMQDCVPLKDRPGQYKLKFQRLVEALEGDRIDFEGYQSLLINALKPLSFEAELRRNVGRFTGRDWVFDAIDRWLSDAKAPRIFWITGGPGIGKTAIAAWLCTHRPEIVAFHFCRYDNTQKRDARRAIASIAYQLSTQLPEYEERLRRVRLDGIDRLDAPTLFDQLIAQPLASNYPDPGRSVVVLIDALDEATIEGRNELAGFLAAEFEKTPPWLRLVLTSRPTPEVMAALQAYTPFTLDIADPRNERDIAAFLARELRTAPPAAIDALAKKADGLFLYADWIVAEVRQGRLSLDKLDEFPRGLGGVYLRFFERQFPDIGEWEARICPVLEVVAAAQEPLTLKQLAAMFRWSARDERKFRGSLGGLFGFNRGVQPFHRTVIDWLADPDKHDPYFISPEEGHKILAAQGWHEYESPPWSPYLIAYLPLHLCLSGDRERLRRLLTDLKFLGTAWRADRFKMLGTLAFISERAGLKIKELYGRLDPEVTAANARDLLAAAEVLMVDSCYDEEIRVLERLATFFRCVDDLRGLSDTLYQFAIIYNTRSEHEKLLAISQELKQISNALRDREILTRALEIQLQLAYIVGNQADMLDVSREMERICRETCNVKKLSRALYYQAFVVFEAQGDFDRCLALLKEAEAIDRENGFTDELIIIQNIQGELLRFKGALPEALAVYREVEANCRRLGIRSCVAVAIGNQALTVKAMGNLDDAMALFDTALTIGREAGFSRVIAASLDGQGEILRMRGRLAEAMTKHKEAELIDRKIGFKQGLQECLGYQAVAFALSGDRTGAEQLFTEQEAICREAGLKRELQACLDLRKQYLG